MIKGYVALILHAHLPYVHHPESEDYLEERWLFEAISETYIPLISSLELLLKEGVDFRITMSVTPPLVSMLENKLLQSRYIKYLEKLIKLCEKEIVRTEGQSEFNSLAQMYKEKYINDLYAFKDNFSCSILNALNKLKQTGKIEFIACAATHGYLPLICAAPEVAKAQIAVGVRAHENFFGERPKGMWLPECGYVPAVEKALRENKIEYIITESHGILYAKPKPVFGTYAPIVSPNGIVAFGRDVESSKQVWSSTEGYPGDYDYREFYRDIGYDLDYDYINEYISPDGRRIDTGIKYYRITGKTEYKQPYNPEWARNKADMHAGNFMFNREKQIQYLSGKMDRPPVIICPYDAELFGHWWYEGPIWLYSFLKKAHYDQKVFKMTTLSEYLDENPVMQVSAPCPSSWGLNGYNEVWLNRTNDWIYTHLSKASERMIELANSYRTAEGIKEKALNQAARELLLAQSSDWAFIMKMGTMVGYAEKRTKDHIGRFTRLYHDIKENSLDEAWLGDIEHKDDIFPELDFRVYASS